MRATLRPRDAFAITVGVVIGAGIFRAPSIVADAAGSEAAVLLAWLMGGLLSIAGALCYAELASAHPHVGGDYHFLERAYGPRLGFLYAWARIAVIQTGSLALLAYVFGDYMSAVAPLGAQSATIYAAAVVILISAANWAGVQLGTGLQRWLTLVEVGGLVLIIAVGLLFTSGDSTPLVSAATDGATSSGSVWGLMMIFVLLTYGGWSEAVYVSGELRDARRNIAPVLVGGLVLITVLYLLLNIAFLKSLGLAGLAASQAPTADVMRLAFGGAGAAIISLLVACAALTSANATVITGARSTCAMGQRFRQLRWLGHWHDGRATPANAILVQGLVALLLVIAGGFARGGFELAVDYTAPVFWLFLLLVSLSLFILRWRDPDAERPFRVPLYPVLPAVFTATCAYLLYSSVAFTGAGALVGIGVLVTGGIVLALLDPLPEKEFER